MAIQTALTHILGDDATFQFTVYRSKAKSAIRDISSYTMTFMVKRNKSDADGSALFSGSATVSGTYHADPATNTQVAQVTIADTDLPTSTTAGQVHWALKRTDAGAEQVLAYGRMLLIRLVHDA